MSKLSVAVVFCVLVSFSQRALSDSPYGAGEKTTGGWGLPAYDWRFGKNSVEELKAKMKAGNVYIRMWGKGVLKADDYWPVGSNTTVDGSFGQITIDGPKGLWVINAVNVVIRGLCFTNNETGVNMSGGGHKVWVHKNTFMHSSWGSPIAFSGFDCSGSTPGKAGGRCKAESTQFTISENRFGPSHYGPLMFLGVQGATFQRNYFVNLTTRIPRAQNQGIFHICNNVIHGWDLGIQGDDGARFVYENNAFICGGKPWKNNMNMNENERIDVCMKGNIFSGPEINQYGKKSQLVAGPKGGTALTCDPAKMTPPYPHKCSAINNKMVNEIKSTAGVGDWCKWIPNNWNDKALREFV